MENEWITNFRSILRRISRSKIYWYELVTALVMGGISVPLLWMLQQSIRNLPESTVQLFWTGSNYQIGFLALPDWRSGSNGYCDEIIRGVFAGTLVSISAEFHVARFIGAEYRGAYLQLWLMRGQNRKDLFCLYELGVTVGTLPILLLFQVGTCCSLILFGVTKLHSPGTVIAVVLVQLMMLCCLCFCSVAIVLNLDEHNGILLLICSTVSAPVLSSYLFLLTKSSRFSSGVLLLTRLMNSSALTKNQIPETLIVSFITTVVLCAVGYLMFLRKYIE